MRISSQSIFDVMKLRLARSNEELFKANRIVATGKRINTLSDDPVGLAQSLDVKSSLSNLDQLDKNIARAKTWLGVGETALDHVKDLISEAKQLCFDLNGGSSLSTSDQAFALDQVNGILTQIQQLANTTVDGQYLFAGTKIDIKPFELDDEQNPTRLTYNGNHEDFSITIGRDTTVAIGHDGETIFEDSTVTVNDTNNKIDFVEDPSPALGDETTLSATIPEGKYTASQLAAAIENAMEAVSVNGVDYTVAFDAGSKRFSIQDDGSLSELQLLWQTGAHASTSIGSDIGFNGSNDSAGSSLYTGQDGVQWGIFKTLIDLRDYIQAGDVEGVNRSITRLSTHLDHLVGTMSEKIASKQVRLDMKENMISDLRFRYEEIRSGLEDADITEAIMDLTSKEFAYQVLLSSAAKILETSLVDYL